MGICVLLTSVGGLVAPGIIDNLRNHPEVFRIIGTDVRNEAIGFYMVDQAHVVPRGDDPNYLPRLWEIIQQEGVDVIIPCSDEEALAFSAEKQLLKDAGVVVLCSPHPVTSLAVDKGSMLNFALQHGIPVPKFSLPTTIRELFRGAKELGYPVRPVVIKPRRGRGGRGVRVLKEEVNVLGTRDSREMKLEWLVDALRGEEPFEIVLMEYLPGEDYSVDVLADRGRLLGVVPRIRIEAILGPSRVGQIVRNQEVVDIVESVVKAFGFDSNVNIQLKYSAPPDERPMIYEINPRVSGTIVASTAAGVDLLYHGIRLALGQDLPASLAPRSVKMIRYLKEYFVN